MYSEFYHIPEQPFGESPDPRFLYESAVHSHTLVGLLDNFESGARLQILIASPGSGKTTLLHALLERLGERVTPAFVFFTLLGAKELLGFLLRELGLVDPGPELTRRREVLMKALSRNGESRRPVLAVIDEAQHLEKSAFDELDSLLAHTSDDFKVILSGQTELTRAVNTDIPGSLRERIGASHQLLPLDLEDTIRYVRHRLRVAGYTGPELFTLEALKRIATESAGIPRNINTLCSHALDHGAAIHQPVINEDLIKKVLPRCAFTCAERVAPTPSTGLRPTVSVSEARSSTPRPTVRKTAPPSRPQNSRLAELLREWLADHCGIWSGTPGELLQHLHATHAPDLAAISISSAAELAHKIRWNEAALLGMGVDVELRTRPGGPQRVMLRLVHPY